MEGKTNDNVKLADVLFQLATVFSVDMTDELVAAYFDALSDLEPSIVKLASSEILREAQFMPRPAELRRVARKIAAEASGKLAEPEHWRKDKYDCRECRDTGWISVWHPRAQAAARAYVADHLPEDKFRRNLYEAAAKCRCQRGQTRPGEIATFDPNIHARITAAGHANRVEELLEWARRFKPANYVSEFDDWSAQTAQDPF